MSVSRSPSLARRSRPLTLLAVAVFGISVAFPIFASLSQNDAARWVGALDVAVALVLVIVMGVVDTLARGQVSDNARHASFQAYRLLANLLILLLVVFFVFGEQIKWHILLPGLAWRMWLLMYVLPAWFTLWKLDSGARGGG